MVKSKNFLKFDNGIKFYYEKGVFYYLKPVAKYHFGTIFDNNGKKVGYVSGNAFVDNAGNINKFIYEPVFTEITDVKIWQPKSFIIDCLHANKITVSSYLKDKHNLPDDTLILKKWDLFDPIVTLPKTKDDIHSLYRQYAHLNKSYMSMEFDCDDFAFLFNVYCKYWGINGMLIATGKTKFGLHVMTITVTEDKQLWVIEPQNGDLFKGLGESPFIELYSLYT